MSTTNHRCYNKNFCSTICTMDSNQWLNSDLGLVLSWRPLPDQSVSLIFLQAHNLTFADKYRVYANYLLPDQIPVRDIKKAG